MTQTSIPDAGHDRQLRFLIDRAGVRGVHVRLDAAWQQIRERETYPAPAAELLGQACAAAALFTGHAKVDGRLSVQLRSDGAIRTLFVECTAAGTLRGLVQVADAPGRTVSADLRDLGPGAILAITIENHGPFADEPVRYQGLVPLEARRLNGAFEDYFRQSEQLPTRILLAANEFTCAGLMLQKLPGDEGDEDGWDRIGMLSDTLSPAELLEATGEVVLHRLFHEDTVQILGGRPLSFACSCSQGRVESMLVALGIDEARLAAESGQAEVRCEFCGQRYGFSAAEVEGLFQAPEAMPPPARLQ